MAGESCRRACHEGGTPVLDRCVNPRQGERNLAKPNFGYQKRQKELEKKRKKEEKMKKKLEKNAAPAADAPAPAPEGVEPV
jgi:hypothetical protein